MALWMTCSRNPILAGDPGETIVIPPFLHPSLGSYCAEFPGKGSIFLRTNRVLYFAESIMLTRCRGIVLYVGRCYQNSSHPVQLKADGRD